MTLLHCLGIIASLMTQGERTHMTRFVSVTGNGRVQAIPDMAKINVGVLIEKPTAHEAIRENSRSMKQLLEVLRESGIEDRDIQTSSFKVAPVYSRNRNQGTNTLTGYRVSNSLSIRVRKLDSVGSILDEVVKGGANQVYGMGFSVADPSELFDKARVKAVADARKRAELYAKAGGFKLRGILRLEETSSSSRAPGVPMARAAMAESVPLAPGEQDFSAQIHVTYAIE